MKAIKFLQSWAFFALLLSVASGLMLGIGWVVSHFTPQTAAGIFIVLFSGILAWAYQKAEGRK